METQQNFYPGENEEDIDQQAGYSDETDDTAAADDVSLDDDDDLDDEDLEDDDLEEDDDYENQADDTEGGGANGSLDTRIGADSDVDDSDAQSAI